MPIIYAKIKHGSKWKVNRQTSGFPGVFSPLRTFASPDNPIWIIAEHSGYFLHYIMELLNYWSHASMMLIKYIQSTRMGNLNGKVDEIICDIFVKLGKFTLSIWSYNYNWQRTFYYLYVKRIKLIVIFIDEASVS